MRQGRNIRRSAFACRTRWRMSVVGGRPETALLSRSAGPHLAPVRPRVCFRAAGMTIPPPMWDRMLDGYRTFPVLQKPFHRAELTDTLARLLTPKEHSVGPTVAIVGKTLP